MSNILIGCDPEVFMKNKDGQFISAHNMIPGDKKKPFPVSKGAVQVDGMALEFNINPAASENEFLINVEEVFATLRGMVPDYEVVAVPVADFGADYMKDQPKEALELGCDPDYNGWNGQPNPRPNGDRPFRTASGHVHIGWTQDMNIKEDVEHISNCFAVAKQLDYFLGLPSLAYDLDKKRRELYGRAGACRIKSYGVEYRTLSNRWLSSKELIRWVYRATQEGMNRLMNGDALFQKHGDIQDIINNSDWHRAEEIISIENIEVPHV